MRDALIDACRTLTSGPAYNDFWVLSSARDSSFEEGDKSASFKGLIRRLKKAGIAEKVLLQLRAGINGNLAGVIEEQSPQLGRVRRNKGKGHDLIIGGIGVEPYGLVEVKLVYECTSPQYYASIARDFLEKLATSRKVHANAALFLVVFFLECPHLDYPAGRWADLRVSSKKRRDYKTNSGIASQFNNLSRKLGVGPSWPSDGPIVFGLHSPHEVEIRRSMVQLYEDQFTSLDSWRFDSETSLSGVRVGFALWEYPRNG